VPAERPPLTDALLDNVGPASSSVRFRHGGASLVEPLREQVAQLLADDAVAIACAEPLISIWRARSKGEEVEAPPARLSALAVHLQIAFGLPAKPPTDDHLQGTVAELFWNRLSTEAAHAPAGMALVVRHPVKADPLEPGGDGLAIYRDNAGGFHFRLWEIKKHTAKKSVSNAVNKASKQLRSRGSEYLAKFAAPSTIVSGGELASLYSTLVELWIANDASAGVGVAVTTSDDGKPKGEKTFESIATQFPSMSRDQRDAFVVSVPSFREFAIRVQEIVWSGL
jgi:hypothetical protein